jgi:ubiquitin C-terminal hydrolase
MAQSKGIVGLTNIGNTCYGNATLQVLRHQVDFTIFLLQDNHKDILKNRPASERTGLLTAYGDLVKSLWMGENGTVSTRPFWSSMIPAAIKSGFEQFRVPIPHDSHEFLVFLLDEFHEALKEEVTMTIRAPDSSPDVRGALTAWKTAFEKSYSPLVELVFGLQRKGVLCEGCKKESVSWDTMNCLKVSVPKQAEAVDLLDLVIAEGKTEEIDEYSCDHCKPQRHKAKIVRSLWRLGNWVIVVMKRIENNGRRINTPVNIPLQMNFGRAFHEASAETSRSDTYDLFGTIHHHGSAGGGHYTAQARHPVSGQWAHYDDESARSIPGPSLDPSTYIVMYRKLVPSGTGGTGDAAGGAVEEEDASRAKEA